MVQGDLGPSGFSHWGFYLCGMSATAFTRRIPPLPPWLWLLLAILALLASLY